MIDEEKNKDGMLWYQLKRAVPTGLFCKNHPDTELNRFTHPASTNYDPLIHGELTSDGLQLSSMAFCKKCDLEGVYQRKQQSSAEIKANEDFLNKSKYGKYSLLKTQSLVGKKSLWFARFNTFKVNGLEEQNVLNKAQRIAREYTQGQRFNTVFVGGAGRGKSHLAMAILQEVNENLKDNKFSTLFINISELIREIKNSWNYSDTKAEEERLTTLMRTVDLLVIDDLGTESTFSKDNSWVQGVIYNIYNAREGNTIITSNLTGKEMRSSYDDKIVSRIMEGSKNSVVKFEGITDKRKSK
ncbi:ATP-binding protein [Lactococcus lactis]|uniref:ATP-binding protein n=1 Tax=Lactococcus lactis TaxID=1358 RepID=UPI0018AAEE3F|nr:ATP-binding protein [Lactococcus lactis]